MNRRILLIALLSSTLGLLSSCSSTSDAPPSETVAQIMAREMKTDSDDTAIPSMAKQYNRITAGMRTVSPAYTPLRTNPQHITMRLFRGPIWGGKAYRFDSFVTVEVKESEWYSEERPHPYDKHLRAVFFQTKKQLAGETEDEKEEPKEPKRQK